MLISHEYKFIFIKTTKTAGTSIEVLLASLLDERDVVTPIYPPEPGHQPRNFRGTFSVVREARMYGMRGIYRSLLDLSRRRRFYDHIPAARVRGRVSESIWNNYMKFCVERNPWDKTLSHYSMWRHRSGGTLSLDDYFANGRFCLNFPSYTDKRDPYSIIVDKVLRYESLQNELANLLSELGVTRQFVKLPQAKGAYRVDRRPYWEVFTSEQATRISEVFSKEIELHGYTYRTTE